VLDISNDFTIVQVLGSTEGLQTDIAIKFAGTAFKIPVTDEVLGRTFNGIFRICDLRPSNG